MNLMKINREENEISIFLSSKLYDLQIIKEVLADFKEVCEGHIEESNLRIKIVLKPKEKDILDVIGYEFCNYVLGLMKNKLLV